MKLIYILTIITAVGCSSTKMISRKQIDETVTNYFTYINEGRFKEASQLGVNPSSDNWKMIIALGEGTPLEKDKKIKLLHIEIDYIRKDRAAVDLETYNEEKGFQYNRMILKRVEESWKIIDSIYTKN